MLEELSADSTVELPSLFILIMSPDEEAIKDTLKMNSHQDFFIAPIVTLHDSQYFSQHLLEHELKLEQDKIINF